MFNRGLNFLKYIRSLIIFGTFFRDKRASIQISMSWIFMIFIGTFFLVFSYNVIDKYHTIENEKFMVNLNNALRSILNNVGRTSGLEENSFQPIGNIFKDSKVKILCEYGMPIISINGKLLSESQYLRTNPIFMTYIEQKKIDQTYLVTENFKLPFKITTMLALVSKKNLIIMDNNSEIVKDLLFKFNRGSYNDLNYITKDFKKLSDDDVKNEIDDKNYNSIIFVSDNGKKPNIDLDKIKELSYFLEISRKDGLYGDLNYTLKDGSIKSFNYIDYNKKLALPTMAIFSSPDTFNCSYNLLKKTIGPIYSFYSTKSAYLINLSKTEKLCSDSILTQNEYIKYNMTKEDLDSFMTYFNANGFSKPKDIITKIRKFENDHKEIEDYSCIYLY